MAQPTEEKKVAIVIGLDLGTLGHLVERYLNARIFKILVDVYSMSADRVVGQWEYKAHLKWNGGRATMTFDPSFLRMIMDWAFNGMALAGNMVPATVVDVKHHTDAKDLAAQAESAVVFVRLETRSLGPERVEEEEWATEED